MAASNISSARPECQINQQTDCNYSLRSDPYIREGEPNNIPLNNHAWEVWSDDTPRPREDARTFREQSNRDFREEFHRNNMENQYAPRKYLTSEFFGFVQYTEEQDIQTRSGRSNPRNHRSGTVKWNLYGICKAFHEEQRNNSSKYRGNCTIKLDIPVVFSNTSKASDPYTLKHFSIEKQFNGRKIRYEVCGVLNRTLRGYLQEKLNAQPECGVSKEETTRCLYGGDRTARLDPTTTPQTKKGFWSKLGSFFKYIFCCLCLCRPQEID